METRRNFIRTGVAATAGLLCANSWTACQTTENNRLRDFGFIAGIAQEAMQADWKGTLKKAAALGYTEIEGGNNFAPSTREFLSYCKSTGIKPILGGTGLEPILQEPQKHFDEFNELNYKYFVIYWPWFGGAPVKLEDCKKSAAALNELGRKAKANGLTLLWHNHDLEFHEMEEGLPFDYLMENTDPALVQCEMDIYWVKKGGGDPLEVLKKYAGRIPVLHVKDMAPDGDFICPGRGIIDFAPIFREAKKQGIRHYFVERDNEPDGMGCLTSAAGFLKNLRF